MPSGKSRSPAMKSTVAESWNRKDIVWKGRETGDVARHWNAAVKNWKARDGKGSTRPNGANTLMNTGKTTARGTRSGESHRQEAQEAQESGCFLFSLLRFLWFLSSFPYRPYLFACKQGN